MKLTLQKITSMSASFAVMWVCALPPAAACTRNNHVRPADVAADTINSLFEQKKYDDLDRLYDKYVSEKTATPDGISSLSVFFKGISQSFNACSAPAAETAWLAHQDSLLAWVRKSPKSTGAKLALALFTIDFGWHGRGSGPASTVDQASRKLHDSRMASAKLQLDALAEVSRNNPAWYSGMLYLGLAQGWKREKMDALYDTAVRLDPYYIDTHFDIAQYYSARWYGSDAQMHAVIDRSAELTKKRLGQTMYARLHWTNSKSPAMFQPGGVKWERMKTGFSDYLKIYPENKTRNNFAIFACMARDSKALRQQLNLLGDQVDPQVWGAEYYAACSALAANGKAGK